MIDLKNAKNRNGKMCQAVTVDVVSSDLRLGDIGAVAAPAYVACDGCGVMVPDARLHTMDERRLCPACVEAADRPDHA